MEPSHNSRHLSTVKIHWTLHFSPLTISHAHLLPPPTCHIWQEYMDTNAVVVLSFLIWIRFYSALHIDGYSSLIYTSSSWGRTERSEFISLLLVATAHPLQCFQMKLWQTQSHFVTVFIPAIDSCSYFPISSNIFTVLLALCINLFCFSLPGLHINIHFRPLTASGGWRNSYHPTHLSGHSPCLAVALWFSFCVSVSAAFL